MRLAVLTALFQKDKVKVCGGDQSIKKRTSMASLHHNGFLLLLFQRVL